LLSLQDNDIILAHLGPGAMGWSDAGVGYRHF
jgi:hypothetical protein